MIHDDHVSKEVVRTILSGPKPFRPGWVLFVTTQGSAQDWPDFCWPEDRIEAPTIAERNRALAKLGFAYAECHRVWSWEEDSPDVVGEDAPVQLIAVACVRPATLQETERRAER